MCKVLIADDHPVVLLGTQTYLTARGYQVVGMCGNGLEAYNQIVTLRPDIALLDMNMPGLSGMDILQKLNQEHLTGKIKIILLTMHNELSLFNRAKELNVKGYLLKDFAMDELEKCLQEIQAGNTYFSKHLAQRLTFGQTGHTQAGLDQLTFAEKKILELVSQQKSTREIAAILFISEKTVETHRSHIIKKLNIPPGKNALLMWAMKQKE
ncbi:response regulator transcription factor [Taibaiella helva]|uniref:response regulator transcription factor n=1 Tax=Taibaiella helva TaxID=2301235 RepID=UPI000E574100|nr:response regulator transcription factor [Taibaiella helva]